DRDVLLLVMCEDAELLEELLSALEAQVGATDHEQRREGPRRELAEEEGDRNDDEELVAERAHRNLLDDGQLALRLEPGDIARRHGRVVDDDPGSLRSRTPRGRTHVIDRRGGELGQRSDVVEECCESTTHARESSI